MACVCGVRHVHVMMCTAHGRREQTPLTPRLVNNSRPAPGHPAVSYRTHVDIQDPTSKLWTRRGVIVGIGRHRDYNVKLPSGRILCHNRRYLRPRIPAIAIPSHDQSILTPCDSSSASQSSQPRTAAALQNHYL